MVILGGDIRRNDQMRQVEMNKVSETMGDGVNLLAISMLLP